MILPKGLAGFILLLCVASFLIACCAGEDAELTGGGVRCKILGNSGKIMIELIGNNTEGNFSKPNEDRLTFEVDEIKEIDSQENAVGTSGPNKHTLNGLASVSKNFTKVDNVSYYQGIKVINVNLSAYLPGPKATLDVLVFLFLESGNVTFGNESFTVYKGTLKFNIKITDWDFCDAAKDNCKKGQTKQTGEFIDLTLQVKSKGTPKKESKEDRGKSKKPICHKDSSCPEVYDMGGGSLLVLNKGIKIDGEDMTMPDPFPKFATQGPAKTLFTFRIPRFNDTIVIDPTSSVGGSEGGGDVSGGGETGGGDATTPMPTTQPGEPSSASLLLFNLCALAFCLYVAAMFTVPFTM